MENLQLRGILHSSHTTLLQPVSLYRLKSKCWSTPIIIRTSTRFLLFHPPGRTLLLPHSMLRPELLDYFCIRLGTRTLLSSRSRLIPCSCSLRPRSPSLFPTLLLSSFRVSS